VDKYVVKHTIKSCIDQSSQTNKIKKKRKENENPYRGCGCGYFCF
jgi:hypothetical protein